MRPILFAIAIVVSVALAPSRATAQYDAETHAPVVLDDDHGELPRPGSPAILASALSPGFGYNYDSLLADIARWIRSPYVTVSTIGTSVKGRPIWQLTITSPANLVEPREMIAIHARTHPNEVQSTYVVNAIIGHLLSDDPAMKRLLGRAIFNIVPMYNPDGVELEHARENADGIDLEREWDKDPAAIEAASLKRRYADIMSSPTPIRVALNLHSAYLCKRYFVYHVESATSPEFASLEQRFIGGVRSYFAGIEPWDFYQSWTTGAPTHFPESWFWFNFGSRVMALTYEDMHCDANGAYDTTAYALLRGVADYLQIDVSSAAAERSTTDRAVLRSVAPNPFAAATTIRFALGSTEHVTLLVRNELGAEIARLVDEELPPGWHEIRWDAPELSTGVYYVTVQAGATTNTIPVLKIR
jgi:hypothetical protein